MARRRKDQANQHRLPSYHRPSDRWRLRIEHHHGVKEFYWPADGPSDAPPPKVVAGAVAVQDQWFQLVADWPTVRSAFRIAFPAKDWSKPVFVSREEINGAETVAALVIAEEKRAHESDIARSAGIMGLDRLMNILEQPGSTSLGCNYTDRVLEQERLRLLKALRPAQARLQHVTIRQALAKYLEHHKHRTTYKSGDGIDESTFATLRKATLAAFGLSSKADMGVNRADIPLNLNGEMILITEDQLEEFARYWFKVADGEKSSRSVKNWLVAAKAFFTWCASKSFGFEFPDLKAKLFTAADVKTDAKPFVPDQLLRIAAQGKTRGGNRLRLYMQLALMCGYTQADISKISLVDYYTEDGETYIHRFRTKEKRSKRGSRPIRVKHWIPSELVALIEAERGQNSENFLFNSERGTVLKPKSVTNIWTDANEAAGETLSFKQLRKIAYNRIKRFSSDTVAELWEGHAAGVTESYSDGEFLPVIEAQKLFAQELRDVGLL